MAESYYKNPRPVSFGTTSVEIKVKRLSHGVKRDLRNFFSNYALERDTGMFEGIDIPAGNIEDVAIRRGLEELRVGGQLVQFNSPSKIDDFPEIGLGDESEEIPDLYEEVLKTLVDRNRWLAWKYPFTLVFAQYLTLVEKDKRDYEEKQAGKTGAKADTVSRDPADVGPNPTRSEQDTSIGTRISGSAIT